MAEAFRVNRDPSLWLIPEFEALEVVDLAIDAAAAQAHAEIARLAHEARCHANHVFGALIAWNRKRFERIACR